MMKLSEILKHLNVLSVVGDEDRFIRDIQYDSRRIEPEQAFVAMKGFETDGHRFIRQAYQKGARVFFVQDETNFPDATVVRLKNTRKSLAEISRIFFNEPDQKLKIVGITGTNGKTTTAYLLHSILNQAHWKPGLISTVQYYDGKSWEDAERTTPESLDIFRYFSRMVQAGLRSAVMEVSSHALSLHRVEGIHFAAGVFTNLGRDHLDFHKTMGRYFAAKRKLFEGFSENQKVVLNADDRRSKSIEKVTGGEIFTYSMNSPAATVKYLSHKVTREGMQLKVRVPSGDLLLSTSLLGSFNIYNILAATATAVSLGLQENFIADGIQNLRRVPGRCEIYRLPDSRTVYVDYAHTPQGLQNILKAVWETRPENLIVVFGAGGKRDRGKRPEMGKAAEDFADRIILTNDNPRDEDPSEIIDEIMNGIYHKEKVRIIPDRKAAIREALTGAGKRDAVVIAGKGHEKYQEINGKKYPFDDHQVVHDYFSEMGWPFVN